MKISPRRANGTEEQGSEDVKQILEKISVQLEKLENQGTSDNTPANNKTLSASAIHKETAGQVLAQSQTKLTLELEATLASLQRVIGESEKIAMQIESLLGESEESG